MAKKSQNAMLINLLFVVLSAIVLVSLFIPVLSMFTKLIVETTTGITGFDVIGSCFTNLEAITAESSEGLGILCTLKESTDYQTIVTIFSWAYFVTVLAAAGSFVCSLLNILQIKLVLFNKIFAAVLGIGALIAIILGFIVAGYITEFPLYVASTGSLAIGGWLLITGIIYFAGYLVAVNKKAI